MLRKIEYKPELKGLLEKDAILAKGLRYRKYYLYSLISTFIIGLVLLPITKFNIISVIIVLGVLVIGLINYVLFKNWEIKNKEHIKALGFD